MHATIQLMRRYGFPAIRRDLPETLQVNLGYRCNQSCAHCHVNAGPNRAEQMSRETIDEVLAFLSSSSIKKLDVTGGAPELNPYFRELVMRGRKLGVHVIDRCNLTILEEPANEDLAEFLARHGVEVVASLPCYLSENVDRQRGQGVFEASIRGLRRLNAVGYGRAGSGLVVNLVYNPQGPSLPPAQAELELAYKRELKTNFGVEFNQLYTLANMPIQRFGSMLVSKGQFNDYMALLHAAHRDENLESVMCRTTISVDWQGFLYDCDFNQMLGLPLAMSSKRRVHLSELKGADLRGNPIQVFDHCYGCTAGQGSSCGGALGAASEFGGTSRRVAHG
ncbi:MAG: arsenosugar biosynthesis radical SAM protein ArsS [Betaproteobacteria bacterium]|nr:arsenosugar biosynthesis radical SAM protein ArsS [Betaproteobacteria bacterium]